MAVPQWPTTLPTDVLQSGFMEGVGDGRLRTPMDAGPGKVRPYFNPARPLQMRFWMTGAQVNTFRTFLRDDLAGGPIPFNFVSPRDGSTLLLRFAESMPSWSAIGPDLYEVSLDLEVLP